MYKIWGTFTMGRCSLCFTKDNRCICLYTYIMLNLHDMPCLLQKLLPSSPQPRLEEQTEEILEQTESSMSGEG